MCLIPSDPSLREDVVQEERATKCGSNVRLAPKHLRALRQDPREVVEAMQAAWNLPEPP